jgi:hypothetical protein
MNALSSFFGFAAVNSLGRGQANPVQRATFVEETAKRTITLPSTGTVRYWFNDTRPGRPTQSYAGMAG